MQLHRIVAATGDSTTGRRAVAVAAQLAEVAGARLRLITVVPDSGAGRVPSRGRLAAMPAPRAATNDTMVAVGLPGVEIVRYAEAESADLIVLGRSNRPMASRGLIGDIGDAVARRSSIPCLFVPQSLGTLGRVLAALDGTERGSRVLRVAADFTRAIGGRFRAVIVERPDPDCGDASTVPIWGARTIRLAGLLEQAGLEEPELFGRWDGGSRSGPAALAVRTGETVEEVLAELDRCGAGLLAVGHHRGGPTRLLEGRSVGRRLVHQAPTAILTVPL